MVLVQRRSVRFLGLGAPGGLREIGIGRSGFMAPLIFDFLDVGFQDERAFAAFDIVKLRAPELSGQSLQGL